MAWALGAKVSLQEPMQVHRGTSCADELGTRCSLLSPKIGGGSLGRVGVDTQLINQSFGEA